MKHSRILLFFACNALLAGLAKADVTTLTVSEDTYITDNSGFGGPNANQDLSHSLVSGPFYSAPSNNLDSQPLLKFDLTGLSQNQITSDGTLQLYMFGPPSGQYYSSAPRLVRIGVVNSPWESDQVTHNNFGGAVTWGETRSVVWDSNNPRYVEWTIPQSTLQSWLENPDDNHGIILESLTNRGRFSYEVVFASKENTSLNRPALLSFSAIPEPGSGLVLLGISGLAAITRFRRGSQ